jgi:hypothetical protein
MLKFFPETPPKTEREYLDNARKKHPSILIFSNDNRVKLREGSVFTRAYDIHYDPSVHKNEESIQMLIQDLRTLLPECGFDMRKGEENQQTLAYASMEALLSFKSKFN